MSVPIQVGSVRFAIDRKGFLEAARAFRDPGNRPNMPPLTDEQVQVATWLSWLFLEEVLGDRECSLSVWGWFAGWAKEIGDQHGLHELFSGAELLKLKILNSDNYQVLFNEVVVGQAHKLPVDDPVEHRHVPPEMRPTVDDEYPEGGGC